MTGPDLDRLVDAARAGADILCELTSAFLGLACVAVLLFDLAILLAMVTNR